MHRADGVQSTSHPESVRDQVPKRSTPPVGYYNFDEETGRKLTETKKKRDPKNVFSLTSRVSWLSGSSNSGASSSSLPSPTSTYSTSVHPVKNGEIDPSHCLTPKEIQQPDLMETALETLTSNDVDNGDDEFDDSDVGSKEINVHSSTTVALNQNQNQEHNVSDELNRLMTMSDSDEDFKHWGFSDHSLVGGQVDYDSVGDNGSNGTSTEHDAAF